jgi:outer membrane protein OmpA-like peptidoglycan-associated protein
VVLACQHSASATFTATLTLTSDDGVSSTDVATLTCETIPGPPAVAVTPATVTFPGVQRVGTPASVRTITISNGNEAQDLTYSATTSSATEFPLSCAGGGTACLSGTLAANGSAEIQVGFVPSTTGGRSGSVTIATNDTNPAADAMKVVPVSGTGGVSTAAGAMTLAFGDVNISTVGGSSLTYRLTNSGTVSLNLGTLAITGDPLTFNFNQTGCAGTTTCAGVPAIAPSAFTDLTLRCDPSSVGSKTATLTIPSDDPLTPKVVMLTCNGTTPDQENLDLPVAAFPNTRVGTPSAAQTFRIRNNAGATTAPLVINSITSSSGDFLVTCTPAPCARTVPAGALVTVNVVFQPTATGSRTGTIAVRTNDLVDGTTDVPVSGTGVEPTISLTTPAGGSLSFADTRVNTASAAQTITITNTGSMDLTINSVTNSNAADFILTGPTGVSTVGAGMTLSWMVQCEPNTQGTRNGTITIANNSANQTSLPVSLTCSAIRGNLTVTSSTPFAYNTVGNRIDFGATFLGQTKMTTVTIGNDGNRPVTIVTPTVTASQGFTLGAPSGMTVPAGGSITLVVTFLPTLVTHGTATVSIASDWNTLAFEVTGDGQDTGTIFALDPPCLNGISTFSFAAPVVFDATASQQFCFKNLGEAPAQITGVQLIDMSPGGPNFTVSGIPLVAPFPTLNRDQARVFTITAVPNDTMLGTFTATLRITTTLPGADAVRDLTVTYSSSGPGLTVGPAMALAFGGVDVDAGPAMLPLTLQNTGTAPLPITNIAPGPTGRFSIVGTPPTSIAVGATETIMVSYDPTVERSSATTESSTFTINTGRYFMGGVAQPTAVMITMTGYGIDQHIEVRGDGGQPVVAFGDVYRSPRADDPRARKTIQVCNTGEAPLRVTMTGGADAPFTVTGGDDLTLAGTAPPPGAAAVCQDVTVEFRPDDETYQPYSDTAQVMNDDDGRAMVDVMLTGQSIARPVTVPSALVAPGGTQIAVDVPTRLSEILAGMPGLTAANVSTSSENFAISIADGTGYTVVGDNDRELTAGETEAYDLTITATQPGPVTVNVAVHLDGDPYPHATVPITVEAIEVEVRGGGGCTTGGQASRGWLALVLGAMLVAGRRRRRVVTAVVAAALVVAIAGTASAQSRDLDLTTFSPAPSTEGAMFAVETPAIGAKGAWAFGLAVNHALSPMKAGDMDIVSARTALELGLAYAVHPKIELGLVVPLLNQQGDNPAVVGLAFDRDGDGGAMLGDVAASARFALVDAGRTRIGASATVTAPTAKSDQFAGTGTVTGAARLLLSTSAGRRLTLALNGGFRFRGSETDFANLTQSHQVLYGAGASVRAAEKLWVVGEAFGRMGLGSADAAAVSPLEATLGVRYRLGQSVAVAVGGGTGLRAGIGAPMARGFLMLTFSPRARRDEPLHIVVPPPPRDERDPDGDGVVNADDACRDEAEDKDSWKDDDGCPDPDNDGDGQADADDKCPDQAEDRDGFEDGDGCVDADNDADGVPDVNDKCPSEPEDKDGFQDDDGCDEADNDGDGIPDVLDQCAMEPETINGNADEDGCPDKGDSLIMVLPDRIEVLEPVTFQGTTTKLAKNATKSLSQIGATLRADRRIKRMRVTVHVHPRGGGDEALSQKRADEIRAWLVAWGVEPERVEAKGIGSKRPLVAKGARGAEQINDRVEFIIFERQ